MTALLHHDDAADLPVSEDVIYMNYEDERHMSEIEALVAKDLSEPYSVFTYRYFLHKWPDLCVCVFEKNQSGTGADKTFVVGKMIACIICKGSDGSKEEGTSNSEEDQLKGYIAMLTVDAAYRKKGIGMTLATIGINRMMKRYGCQEIELETETSNIGATQLYLKLGFIKDLRLSRYYLNRGDAFRLRLDLRENLRRLQQEGEEKLEEKESAHAATHKYSKILILHGGELSTDVAEDVMSKAKNANASLHSRILMVKMDDMKAVKSLVDEASSTLVVFICQTIENASPPETAGACIRFFKRKTHAEDLLKEKFHYAVLGLGDSNLLLDRQTTTANDCNSVAFELHNRLKNLSASPCDYPMCVSDERTGLIEVSPWVDGLVKFMSDRVIM